MFCIFISEIDGTEHTLTKETYQVPWITYF